ncbi:MAG: hypothetical protein JWN90_553 [Parcubacteria group bacterium]|nr:hypothetical protein [Parcubacteria group bacterium]
MILGVTGTNGAGKGTVVDYLVREKGFAHYSVRQEITEEIVRRGLEVNRTNMNEVATNLREQHGPGYFAELFTARAQAQGIENIAIESIRNPFEAEAIKKVGGYMLIVDADQKVRYERAILRGSETDKVSFEEFCIQEAREMESEDPTNPAKMSITAVMKLADATLLNNGSLEELNAQIEDVLSKLH